LTVQEDGLSGIDDPAVLDRAAALGRVLFSQDEDLLAEAKKRQTEGPSFPGVIFAHQIHVTIGDCVRDLELIAAAADPDDCTM
jgi:predicted nuclease of predicted toxin-antitoxin system